MVGRKERKMDGWTETEREREGWMNELMDAWWGRRRERWMDGGRERDGWIK